MERRGPVLSDTGVSLADRTPGERIALALELGRRALELRMAAHPTESIEEAREIMMSRNRFGRSPSRVMEVRGR